MVKSSANPPQHTRYIVETTSPTDGRTDDVKNIMLADEGGGIKMTKYI